MVVVPKPLGRVCICVDLKPLNESMMRKVHPLPSVDATLAQLAGSKIFSKLDTNIVASGKSLLPKSHDTVTHF